MKPVLFILILLLAACAATTTPPPTSLPQTAEPTAVADNPTPQPTDIPAAAPDEPAQAEAMRPAWKTIALTDARTGELFTLADFAGKTIYVEPMATWCTNCRAQMHRVVPVYDELSADSRFAFVSLSVGESIASSDLASYADREGFGWTFAIATPEMLTALSDAFGRAVLTPPSTPHFLIYPDGSDSGLKTGPESTDALRAALLGS
jgi:thiol-disulfide isomerase/thioredoxin